MGVSLYVMGRHKESIECYKKGLKIDPNNIDLHHNMACSLIALGKEEEAMEHMYLAGEFLNFIRK